ncbi:MAG: hypothetical protein QOF78_3409 [Phycisphaerales bacterium]|jgi:plasmid stabilization system protein ParE|nr:hypothetical protein [Phycisphaerales bacterium]
MIYRFTPDARLDLIAAAQFYDDQNEGLGAEFAVDVGLAIARVLDAPNTWPEIEAGIRKYRLDRFPYARIYRVERGQVVVIISVFDLRRFPGSWRRSP